MDVVLVLAVVALAVLLIAAPLLVRTAPPDAGLGAERAELEAAKEAKYREIRDADLDHRTGKLSREDWERLDAALRAEAVAILDRIDALEERTASPKEG
jgi:hypothetical protein